MIKLTPQEKIALYRSIFKGREDVFAIRWEKSDKSASGYTPVCLNEWKNGICIKINKGKCRDCENQNYAAINDYYIEQHLRGNKCYSIYPLLKDNTSHFIAADFDGKNWETDSQSFIRKCESFNLTSYLERSRSGNGGHVWIFFTQKYPAYKSRSIILHILREIKIIDLFDKEDSFDRLFPNQDTLSGKGFGNLIALPLQGKARKNDNTIFLDTENNLSPVEDQWKLLQNIKRISTKRLDQLYEDFHNIMEITDRKSRNLIDIRLREQIFISKNILPRSLTNFLRDNLNFINSDYLIKKRIGLSIYHLEKYFKMIWSDDNAVIIPRGFLANLTNFLNYNNLNYQINDERKKFNPIKFESEIRLFDFQKKAIDTLLTSENGVLVAPPGSGKTIIGIELIKRLSQPSLILVHKKQIFDQWVERIENFLKIPKREIGRFASNKKKIGEKITIGMVQTLNKMVDIESIGENFGLLIVDECHHMPAKMFRNVITKFNSFYLYGLTATPERKNNDAKLIFIHLGEILYTVDKDDISSSSANDFSIDMPTVRIKETDITLPFKVGIDNFQILSKTLTFDTHRNQLIVNDIVHEVEKGNRCLVLSERKEHLDVLNQYLKGKYETIILTGDLSLKQRKLKIQQIESSNFQVLLATGQLIGEGTDFQNLDCLFLVFPFAFKGKLVQYIGRIQRGSNSNKIYDYRDKNIGYLEKFFKQRHRYYKKAFKTDVLNQQNCE